MAIGRTFQESFQKAMRSLETGLDGWSLPSNYKRLPKDKLIYSMRVPNPDRMVAIKQALEDGETLDDVFEYTKIDPWFLAQVAGLRGGVAHAVQAPFPPCSGMSSCCSCMTHLVMVHPPAAPPQSAPAGRAPRLGDVAEDQEAGGAELD